MDLRGLNWIRRASSYSKPEGRHTLVKVPIVINVSFLFVLSPYKLFAAPLTFVLGLLHRQPTHLLITELSLEKSSFIRSTVLEAKRSELYQSKLRLIESEWVTRVGGGRC